MTIKNMYISKNRPYEMREKTTKIAVHYIGNPGTSAINNRNYFNNVYCGVSSNYIVGLEGEVICCIPPDEVSWCTCEANAYSPSIETCHPDSTGKFNDKTYKSLVELVAYLCKKYKIDKDHVIRHYDVNGKNCPKYFVEDIVAWCNFKDDIFATNITPTTVVKIPTVINANLVKEVQKALNSAYKLKLVIDGKLGEKTKIAIKTYLIRNGSKGAYAKWVQKRLNAKGYNIKVDGVFGSKSVAALKKYQKAKGLTVDGICGYATVYELIK